MNHYHYLCLQLLQAGYHQTFVELKKIMKLQKELRHQAGPASVLWNVTLLRDRKDQLQYLVRHLVYSEDALHMKNFDRIYRMYLSIANYFHADENDRWLVKYFLYQCNEVAHNTVRILKNVRATPEKARTEQYAVYRDNEVRDIDQDAVLDELLEVAERRVYECTYHIILFLMETERYVEALMIARPLYSKLKDSRPYRVAPLDPTKETDPEWMKHAQLLVQAVAEKMCACTLQMFETDKGFDTDADISFALLEALEFATECEYPEIS
ncbi:unnamed protein product [Echinostoma caproni]|uniref:KIF-binding protein n=1 Tax=Echinostoma caproni TaxID=27848 RepID=A0A182ZZU6_9TREM|nr:unnamed protein product [Echinostoma caproni]